MNEKKIYLHIGTGKTGTTALQSFFWLNRRQLKKDGIIYPDVGLDYDGFAHHFLGHMWGTGWKTKEELQPYSKDEMLKKLNSLFNKTSKSLLISSEAFTAASVRAFKILSNDLNKYFGKENMKVIIFLRRQDMHLQALYKELIKTALFDEDIEKLIKIKLYDYHRWVSDWVSFLGKENVFIQPYEKNQFINESIFETFMQILNIHTLSHYKFLKRERNISMGFEALEVCKIVNKYGKFENIYQNRLINEQIRQLLDNQEDNEIFKDHTLLSPEERMKFYQNYSDGNRKIAINFLGRKDGKLFYDPLPSMNSQVDDHQAISKRTIVNVMIQLWKNQQKLLNLQKKTIFKNLLKKVVRKILTFIHQY